MPSRKRNITKTKRKRKPVCGPFICYTISLENTDRVYTGQTNNWPRRFRQHKGELSGGARYTRRSKKGRTGNWKPLFHVCGFTRLRHVLQFECAMKKRYVPRAFLRVKGATRARGKNKTKAKTRGPKGRLRQLEYILSLGRLNKEPHSVHKGLSVRCFITKEAYLTKLGLGEAAFERLRAEQGVPFAFESQ